MNNEQPTQEPVETNAAVIEPIAITEANPPVEAAKPSRSNKKRMIVLIGLLLVVLVSAGYFVVQSKKANYVSVTSQVSVEDDSEVVAEKLPKLFFRKNISDADDVCSTNNQEAVYTQGLDQTEAEKVYEAPKGSRISQLEFIGDLVLFEQNEGCTSSGVVMLSKDGGETFTSIFPLDGMSEDFEGGITSMHIATDNKNIYIAFLDQTANTNTVYAYDVETGASSSLFESSLQLVSIVSSDTEKGIVYFREGPCWQCDAGLSSELFVYDVASKTRSVVYDVGSDRNAVDVALNKATSKVLFVSGSEEGLYNQQDIELKEFDIVSQEQRDLTDLVPDRKVFTDVGYSHDTSVPYFVQGQKVFKVVNGAASLVFETSQRSLRVIYLSDEYIVTESKGGEIANQLTEVRIYDFETKETRTLVSSTSLDVDSVGVVE